MHLADKRTYISNVKIKKNKYYKRYMTSLYPRIAIGAALALLIGISVSIASLASAETDGPTVVLSSTSTSATNMSPIPITATFSESVDFFDADAVTVDNGTVSGFAGSGASYTFNVIPDDEGSVSVTVAADVATSPVSGKGNQASNSLVFTYDTTAPVLTEVTGITSPTSDSTPSFTFHATEGGNLSVSGDCSSETTVALSGNTTITFDALANGSYECMLTVTDSSMNASNELQVDFDVEAGVADITDVSVSGITSSGATISWTTDEEASSQVFYGTSASYTASTTLNATASTTHSVALSGLSANTMYHFQVRSVDGDGNVTMSTDTTFTTLAEGEMPVISNVSVSAIGTSGATITWTTDVAADAQVFYGTSASYTASTTLNATASTTHSVVLSGLSEGTVYHFQVRSGNSAGVASSSDSTFVTLSTASSTPLAVTGTETVNSQATADNTFEHGWKWLMHLTIPDVEEAFRMKFSDFTMNGGGSTIAVANNLRIYSSQSSNATGTSSAILMTDNTYGDWFYFTGDASAGTPGRQVDVTIEMKVPSNTPTGTYSTTFGANSTTTSATSTAPD